MNASIVDYIKPYSIVYDREEFPLPDKTQYEDRGWCHPDYAILLYPQLLLDDFSAEGYMRVFFVVVIII